MQRLTPPEAAMVDDLRRRGRTDRQVEKHLGLSNGFLARPWIVTGSDAFDPAKARAAQEERQSRRDAFWRAIAPKERHLRGWRPDGDCVKSRPNATPARSLPRIPRSQGAG